LSQVNDDLDQIKIQIDNDLISYSSTENP